jgi:hypothetical protein
MADSDDEIVKEFLAESHENLDQHRSGSEIQSRALHPACTLANE